MQKLAETLRGSVTSNGPLRPVQRSPLRMADRKVTAKKETGKKVRVWFRKEDGSRTKIRGHYKPDATIQGTCRLRPVRSQWRRREPDRSPGVERSFASRC